MTLPQSNCTLTRVQNQANTDAFRDSEEGADTEVWAGSVPAYYQEKRDRVAGGGTQDLLVRRNLIVEEAQPPVAFESEQVLTFSFGGTSRTGVVQHVERHVLAGMGNVQTTRLSMEPL